MKNQKTALKEQLKAIQKSIINIPNREYVIQNMQDKLPYLDFDGKRFALDTLGIALYLNG